MAQPNFRLGIINSYGNSSSSVFLEERSLDRWDVVDMDRSLFGLARKLGDVGIQGMNDLTTLPKTEEIFVHEQAYPLPLPVRKAFLAEYEAHSVDN